MADSKPLTGAGPVLSGFIEEALGLFQAGEYTDAGKAARLADRVKAGFAVYCKGAPTNIDPDELLTAVTNREGAMPNIQYLHHGLLKGFQKDGFFASRPQAGICVKYTSEAGKKSLLAHNYRFTKGCKLLPPIIEAKVLYGTIAGSHLNIASRCLKHNIASPVGDLSELLSRDSDLRSFVEHGHKWYVIDESAPLALQA